MKFWKRMNPALSVLAIGAVALFLLAPTLVVIPMSFSRADSMIFPPDGFSLRWYENYIGNPTWRLATGNSVIVALSATLCATTLGTLAALGLHKLPPQLRGGIMAVFLLPAILPTVVAAVAMYKFFAQLHISGTLPGLILAHTIMGLPFVVLYVSAVLQKLDPRLDQAARSLGASSRDSFIFVIFPSILPGIMAGAAFAFVTSFDEAILSLFLSGTSSITLPVQIWNGIRFETNPTIAAVSVILLCISLVSFGASAFLRRNIK